MADLNAIFPGSSSAEHANLTYKSGEPLEFDGPTTLATVALIVYSTQGGAALFQKVQTIDEEKKEYDFKLTGLDTTNWPLDSTEEKPALAYLVSGTENGKQKALAVGYLLTEGYVEQPAEEPPPPQEQEQQQNG